MAGRGSACGAPNREKKTKISPRDQPLTSLFTSDSLLGSRAMVSFGGVGGVNESGNSFCHFFDPLGNGDEYLDEYCNQPEKKKRLSVEQVQFLERSFETENKLEPERKIQLADELGLQPRQIAVWFQNRRARWKTKHLETEYETLHASYKGLKTDYDRLLKENDKLKAEVSHLKNNGLTRAQCYTKEPSQAMQREATGSRNDDQSSVRSDMSTNADSPGTTDGAWLLSDESRHMFVADHTDSSRNIGEDIMNEELLQYGCMTDDAYCTPHTNLCGYGFNIEDHGFSF